MRTVGDLEVNNKVLIAKNSKVCVGTVTMCDLPYIDIMMDPTKYILHLTVPLFCLESCVLPMQGYEIHSDPELYLEQEYMSLYRQLTGNKNVEGLDKKYSYLIQMDKELHGKKIQ